MLTYRLEKDENGKKIYLFFPEGNEDKPGKVLFEPNGNGMILEESEDDFKHFYAAHALSGIDKNRVDGVVAWY